MDTALVMRTLVLLAILCAGVILALNGEHDMADIMLGGALGTAPGTVARAIALGNGDLPPP